MCHEKLGIEYFRNKWSLAKSVSTTDLFFDSNLCDCNSGAGVLVLKTDNNFVGAPTHRIRLTFLFFQLYNLTIVSSLPVFPVMLNSMSIFFIYLGLYIAFNTVQVISRRVVGRAEETSTYSSLGVCTVNCRPMASNYLLSHLRPCRESNHGLRGGRRECDHSATVAPNSMSNTRI